MGYAIGARFLCPGGASVRTVGEWRERFAAEGVAGLAGEPRSGESKAEFRD